MKNVITILFVAATILFAGLYVLEINNSKKIEEQLAQKEQAINETVQKLADSKSAAVKLKSSVEEYKEEVAALKNSKEELTSQIAQQAEKLETQTDEAETNKDESAGKKFATGLAEMMDSPEMQETMKMQLETTVINPVFGNLIKELGLDEMDSETFRDLLAHRFMVGASAGIKMMNADKEQRAELKQQIKQGEETVDAMIKDVLGEEGNKKYEEYKNTIGERMACNQFSQQLSLSGSTITPEQNNQLVSAMHNAKLEAQKSGDYFNAEDADPGDFDDANVQKFQQQQQLINNKTLAQSKEILNEKQYEKFELFLVNLQKQQEMQLKMAQKMFGSKK